MDAPTPSATTSAAEVLRVLAALRDAGCRSWLAGGWGVDALVGRQTRAHRDLDLLIDADGFEAAVAVVTDGGYRPVTDWLPVRLELESTSGVVDLHPVGFADEQADGVQAGSGGANFTYPRADLVTGVVADTSVACLSAARQLRYHRGYPPREVDLHDIALLEAVLGTRGSR